ncbi:hypothetical protein [Ottowia sp. SB7-C50]|uniref:hypothetical protein n=1 Tax=Ottowia sp. SB7-C50 TaxID=3081231 RepID=UPI002953A929|nr:hypothetical protein [Ottowia sp. SB7-C50]WOP14584.1 hypothetical protein R0D99_12100 [Ottowia sp. SB7-C50]
MPTAQFVQLLALTRSHTHGKDHGIVIKRQRFASPSLADSITVHCSISYYYIRAFASLVAVHFMISSNKMTALDNKAKTGWDGAAWLGAFLLVSTFAGIVLAIYPGWPAVWSLFSKEPAAWVQAVGSVGAILVAVGVAWYQNKQAMLLKQQERAEQELAHAEACLLFCQRTVMHMGALINNSYRRERTFTESGRAAFMPDDIFDDLELTIRALAFVAAPADLRRHVFDLQREIVLAAGSVRSTKADNYTDMSSDGLFAQLSRIHAIEAELRALHIKYTERALVLGATSD